MLIIRKQQMNALSVAAGQDAVMPCARTWVSFQLVDEDLLPIPDVRYRFVLPDTSVFEGALNSDGMVRFDDLSPGQCEITFAGL